jgi:hypothetical protein
VEAFDWRACFIAAAAAAAVGAAVVVRFRGTLATLPAGAS